MTDPTVSKNATVDLKPCPFCGHRAEVFHLKGGIHSDDEQGVWVQCLGPCCGVRTQLTEGDDPREAIAQWNRRASK